MNTMTVPEPAHHEPGAIDESTIEQKETQGLSQGQIVRKRFFHHKGAVISMFVLLFIILLAFTSVGISIGDLRIYGWWQFSWNEIPTVVNRGNPTLSLFPPVFGDHPFGQDEVGHDIFEGKL